jgi:hypothetical protein
MRSSKESESSVAAGVGRIREAHLADDVIQRGGERVVEGVEMLDAMLRAQRAAHRTPRQRDQFGGRQTGVEQHGVGVTVLAGDHPQAIDGRGIIAKVGPPKMLRASGVVSARAARTSLSLSALVVRSEERFCGRPSRGPSRSVRARCRAAWCDSRSTRCECGRCVDPPRWDGGERYRDAERIVVAWRERGCRCRPRSKWETARGEFPESMVV